MHVGHLATVVVELALRTARQHTLIGKTPNMLMLMAYRPIVFSLLLGLVYTKQSQREGASEFSFFLLAVT